ncbi:MAG: hypothetical protein IPK50_17790 [Fibrobacterota bacterium]|nr:MAG: hypothetical protein IPK50_17790 [Fibrobacterota bacterium]
MYGKTGSGQNVDDIQDNDIGWYVGYVAGKNGQYAFACLIRNKSTTGRNTRDVVEKIFVEGGAFLINNNKNNHGHSKCFS